MKKSYFFLWQGYNIYNIVPVFFSSAQFSACNQAKFIFSTKTNLEYPKVYTQPPSQVFEDLVGGALSKICYAKYYCKLWYLSFVNKSLCGIKLFKWLGNINKIIYDYDVVWLLNLSKSVYIINTKHILPII